MGASRFVIIFFLDFILNLTNLDINMKLPLGKIIKNSLPFTLELNFANCTKFFFLINKVC